MLTALVTQVPHERNDCTNGLHNTVHEARVAQVAQSWMPMRVRAHVIITIGPLPGLGHGTQPLHHIHRLLLCAQGAARCYVLRALHQPVKQLPFATVKAHQRAVQLPHRSAVFEQRLHTGTQVATQRSLGSLALEHVVPQRTTGL